MQQSINYQGNPVEICIGDIISAIIAAEAGADRLEVNSALSLGGLTPSQSMVETILRSVDIPVIVMIRPREGDFLYLSDEFNLMLREAERMLDIGASGIAFGMITGQGIIDRRRVRRMVRLADGRDTVFHRAFDLLHDPVGNMRILQDLGVTRILSSGCRATAWEGREILKQLIDYPGRTIQILPASGIRPENARQLIDFIGQTDIHASCSRIITTPVKGLKQIPVLSEETRSVTDATIVRKLISIAKIL